MNKLVDFMGLFKAREKFGLSYQNISLVGLACLGTIYLNSNYLLVPIKTLVLVGVLASIVVTVIFIKYYKREFGIIWALFHNLTIGCIAVYLFVFTNDILSTKPLSKEIVPIESVKLQDNHQRGNRALEPVILVTIKNRQHKITYHHSTFKRVMQSKNVEITIKEGFWSYWVLTNVEFVKS
ncbi:hypothetical protein [Labilibaculum euxinus]|uniref:Uncharacterized protein n=1 Tax=Labilibaculum euxinus TaxID=2686357 RepID=A0A7M4D0R8_9BACT|nr:hypothetical protein [Labilibaculum euxinus]MUP36247.1 hypothetical protein [Labilibaculum euxinus]MVB05452.1 hypothetical protein [Labilibaculum euxinus]